MKFSEVPNLAKFEQFVQHNTANEIVQHAYKMVEARLGQVPDVAQPGQMPSHGPEELIAMKDRCAAIEESTRIIWACAAATDNINPPMWEDGAPDFQDAVNYFWALPDLEWMELTHVYRISWEKGIRLNEAV